MISVPQDTHIVFRQQRNLGAFFFHVMDTHAAVAFQRQWIIGLQWRRWTLFQLTFAITRVQEA